MSTILVVDDESSVRRLFRETLEDAGYAVIEAADGSQAMTKLGNKPVDLAIVDLVMPKQDGLAVIKDLRDRRKGLKVIAITGHDNPDLLRLAELLGADAVLHKPVTPEGLEQAARQVLKRQARTPEA